jgi:hydrogenase maturation factor
VSGHCITCADEGVALRVLRVDAARELALCGDGDGCGGRGDGAQLVETALIGRVDVGDVLLVHAGTAIARLAERPA